MWNMKSEQIFLYLGNIIKANLKNEEGSLNFGPALLDMGKNGKGTAQDRVLEFYNRSDIQ
jgi:hypothetical protein